MHDTRQVYLVDAFTDEPLSGNPAGVVPEADDLDETQMQAIASELGASETVFLRSSDDADRRLRYFTPTNEVDLCGHATVASHAWLVERDHIDAGEHTFETNTGVLDVTIEDDGTVWMTQNQPEIRRVDVEYETVADALGVDVAALEDVGADLPLAVSSTGLPFLMVPVNFLEHVSNMNPQLGAIEEVSREVDAAGVYAFTFDALDADSTLHGRMFAPKEGVPEDPVTGTASGAAGAYVREYDAFDSVPEEMVFEQGHFVDRPGRVRVRVGAEIEVGGRAVTALDGNLVVPESDEDDIIEA
ncbi:PhzF family phenazine biosynthesis protein [Halorientalis brevis]|uniref:PhzF family phenazine biosynthesis protein n=1 Tax=Halorientalis brevis TaxID=1126241 RepID=A0ABD6CA97_9EURY|nr:PhzF family phenazine biosynthesis protein [Halorientalis brevis]